MVVMRTGGGRQIWGWHAGTLPYDWHLRHALHVCERRERHIELSCRTCSATRTPCALSSQASVSSLRANLSSLSSSLVDPADSLRGTGTLGLILDYAAEPASAEELADMINLKVSVLPLRPE